MQATLRKKQTNYITAIEKTPPQIHDASGTLGQELYCLRAFKQHWKENLRVKENRLTEAMSLGESIQALFLGVFACIEVKSALNDSLNF